CTVQRDKSRMLINGARRLKCGIRFLLQAMQFGEKRTQGDRWNFSLSIQRDDESCKGTFTLSLSHVKQAILGFCGVRKATAAFQQWHNPGLRSLRDGARRCGRFAPASFSGFAVCGREFEICFAPLLLKGGQPGLYRISFVDGFAHAVEQITCLAEFLESSIGQAGSKGAVRVSKGVLDPPRGFGESRIADGLFLQ